MNTTRVAMAFAHPGHEILVAGMLQRYRPALLFLTESDSGGDREREDLCRAGLARMGVQGQAAFLGLSECESYRWLKARQYGPYLALRERILDWLRSVRPTVLFGDAFELTNIHHDLGRALLDSAWREYAAPNLQTANYELPLVCRTEPDPWQLRFQEFPDGGHSAFVLTDEERARKQDLIDWIGLQRVEAALARRLFPPIGREVYRRVPSDRDYATPPAGLRRHYDEWGALQVRLGKYESAITFAEHFVPLVQRLPRLSASEYIVSRAA